MHKTAEWQEEEANQLGSYELEGTISHVKIVGRQGAPPQQLANHDGVVVRAHNEDIPQPQSSRPETRAVLGALGSSRLDRVLQAFRDRFMPHFPFVTIDEEITAEQLRQARPMLFRAVMLVAAPLPPLRAGNMGSELISDLGQCLLLQESRSLDSFQALLVYIAW